MDRLNAHCQALDRAWHEVTTHLAAAFSAQLDDGMTLPQFFLMRLIGGGGLTAGEASQQTGVTPAAITLLATRLVRAGLVARSRDPHDRRLVRLSLTPAGERRLAELEARRLAIIRRLLTALPPADLDALVPIVQRLAAGLN